MKKSPSPYQFSESLLKRLRYKPVVAVVVVQVHVTTVEVQVVRVTTIAGISTGRPVVTVGTEVVKLTIVVIAQRRESLGSDCFE